MPPWILLVEDDDDIRDVMALALETHGYTTRPACDGAEALEILRAASPPPALVLLDLMLPTLSGAELLGQLHEVGLLPGLKVVVLSGNGRARTTARELGAVDCLEKPVDLVDLLRVAERFVRSEESTPAAP